MRTIKITLTDAKYAELMQAIYLVRTDAQNHSTEIKLSDAKSIIPMWCKLNLLRNAEKFARAVFIK